MLNGGDGIDTLSYQLDRAVTVSLDTTAAQDTGGSGIDTVSNFENLTGSYFNDMLTGNDNANVIQGRAATIPSTASAATTRSMPAAPTPTMSSRQAQNNSTVGTRDQPGQLFVQSYSPIIQNSTSTPHATVRRHERTAPSSTSSSP